MNTKNSELRKLVIDQKLKACISSSCTDHEILEDTKVFTSSDIITIVFAGNSEHDLCPKQECHPDTGGSDDYLIVIKNLGGSRWSSNATPVVINMRVLFTEDYSVEPVLKKYTGEIEYELHRPAEGE